MYVVPVDINEAAYVSEVVAVLKYVQDQCLREEITLPNLWDDNFEHR